MTSTAAPLAWGILEAALRQRRPVRLTYHGRQRTVCPHALGWKNDRAMLLAYQAAGGEDHAGAAGPEPRRGWRNLFVEEIDDDITLAEPATTWETADNYNPARPFNSIDELSIAIV